MRVHLFGLAAAAILSPASCSQPSPVRVEIDPAAVHQRISGWEVTPRFWEFDKANNRYDGSWLADRDRIVSALVNQAGVNRVRIEVRSGVENPVDYWSAFTSGELSYEAVKSRFYEKVNDDSDPSHLDPRGFQWSSFDYYVENFVLPMKRELAARGEKLIVNLCYVDFRWTAHKGTLSHADQPEEYSELVAAAVDRLRRRFGLDIESLEIILEPDNTDRWSGEAIGRALVSARRRLAESGAAPRVIAPSPAAAGNVERLLAALSRVKGAAQALDVISYHRYDGAAADRSLPGIRARAQQLGAETEMLEHVDADVGEFFRDMTAGGASAWQLYGAATRADTPAAARPGFLLVQTPDGALSLTPRAAQIASIQRVVRGDAVALGARTKMKGLQVLAFRNKDGSEVVALLADRDMEVQLTGSSAGSYEVTAYTRSGEALPGRTLQGEASGGFLVDVPADAVVLLQGPPR